MRKDISKRISGARSDRKQLSKLRAVLTKGDIDCHRGSLRRKSLRDNWANTITA